MNHDWLLYIMTAFVLVSAIALCIQAGFLFAIYKTSKTMEEKVTAILPRAHSILQTAETTLDQTRKQFLDITSKTNDILDATKLQLVKVDEVLTDAQGRAKTQFDRAEMVLDDTMTRVHESVSLVHNGIMKPLREINGVTTGIRAALQHLAKGGRPSVAQATQDEEMFI